MKDRIAIIGGSNTIIGSKPYPKVLKSTGLDVANFGIGGTNSIYGLMQILKHDILKNFDVLIFEYFINDNNHFFQDIFSVKQAKIALNSIKNLCAEHNTKLLPIFIYNTEDYRKGKYSDSECFKFYHDFFKNNRLYYIDMLEVLKREFQEDWLSCYLDVAHLNQKGMNLLSKEIKNNLHQASIPKTIGNCNKLKLIKAEDFLSTKTFKNSLIDVEYYELLDELEFCFDKSSKLLGIEYLCDINSGPISIESGDKIVHKQSLIKGEFVHKRKKTQLSIMVMCKKHLPASKKIKFKIINHINKSFYDRGKFDCHINITHKPTFKIVSFLIIE